MNIQPLENRAVLKVATPEQVTASGIVLPDSVVQQNPNLAEVISVGGGEEISKLGLSEGDTVVYNPFTVTEITLEGEELKIISHENILALIK